jgi:hypothetical protein
MQKRLLCFSTVAGLCVLAANAHAQNVSAGIAYSIVSLGAGTGADISFSSYSTLLGTGHRGGGYYGYYGYTNGSATSYSLYALTESIGAAYNNPAGSYVISGALAENGANTDIHIVNSGSSMETVVLDFDLYGFAYSNLSQPSYAISQTHAAFGLINTVADSLDTVTYASFTVQTENFQYSSGGSFVDAFWQININHTITEENLNQNSYFLTGSLTFNVAPTDNFTIGNIASTGADDRIPATTPSPAALTPFGLGLAGAYLKRRKRG